MNRTPHPRGARRRSRRGLLAVGAGAALLATLVPTARADQAEMGSWGGYVDGAYVGLDATVLSQRLGLGLGNFHIQSHSEGIGEDLELLQWDRRWPSPATNERSAARVNHVEVSANNGSTNFDLYKAEQRSLPNNDDWAVSPGVPAGTGLPGWVTLGVWSGRAKANWPVDAAMGPWGQIAPGKTSVTAESNIQLAQAAILGDDNPLSSILGAVPVLGNLLGNGPLLAATFSDQVTRVGTTPTPSGRLAAYAELNPTFLGIDLLGGAGRGGLSVGYAGTIDSDDRFAPAPITGGSSAKVRVVADGTPGGASVDGGAFGTEPSEVGFEIYVHRNFMGSLGGFANQCETLPSRDDVCRIGLRTGMSLPLSLGPLSVRVAFSDVDSATRVDPQGRFAEVAGGGITLTVGIDNPLTGEPLLSVGGGIATPRLGVQVPDGPLFGGDTGDSGNVDIDDPNTVIDNGGNGNNNGGDNGNGSNNGGDNGNGSNNGGNDGNGSNNGGNDGNGSNNGGNDGNGSNNGGNDGNGSNNGGNDGNGSNNGTGTGTGTGSGTGVGTGTGTGGSGSGNGGKGDGAGRSTEVRGTVLARTGLSDATPVVSMAAALLIANGFGLVAAGRRERRSHMM